MVTMEQPIMSVEDATIQHFLLLSSASAITLPPRQDRANHPNQDPCREDPALWFLVGIRWVEVGVIENS
jgi:hypothetical protein